MKKYRNTEIQKYRNILLICIISIFIFSCNKKGFDDNVEGEVLESTAVNLKPTLSIETRAKQPMVLGSKKNNPFSVENMKIALDSLKASVNEEDSSDMRLKSLEELVIEPTDLYVRFLPLNTQEYKLLISDTTLSLFDFPLDYEIVQNGDYYHDATVSTPYTWQYTTVKPGYEPPSGIRFEILSELFIVENSEDYTEELLSDTTQLKTNIADNGAIIDRNIGNSLYAISFMLTGNEKELNLSGNESTSNLKATVSNCTRYCAGRNRWRVCWTSCDPYYLPDGYIKVNTPNGDVGVKGVKVRLWRWFSYVDVRTNSRGYYSSTTRFNPLLLGNNINYHIVFDGRNRTNNWTFSRSLFGAVCLWTNYYGAGSHSPNGHSMTFYTNSDYWGRCVLNNAVYDYCDIARADGIALPPGFLDIANKQSNDFTSGAPLLNSHINWSLVYKYPNFWGVVGQLYAGMALGSMYPDLILRYNKTLGDYTKITAIAWHELTHASQLTRMISEKGLLWASDYWSANVYQQVKNELDDGSPYGKYGDARWQIIALSEGWANYREEFLAQRILGELSYNATTNPFLSPYVEMYKRLRFIGCSNSNIEKSLCTYSIAGFRDNLISNHTNLRSQITLIVKDYE